VLDAAYARVMAAYNRWMNERLYELVARVPEEERRRERGAFFGSIHRTLDHIVYADLAFLSRFTGDPAEVPPLGVELHPEFEALRRVRAEVDARLRAWAEGLSDAWLAAPFTYTSRVDGGTRTLPGWVLVAHLFNHQTHHRGQLTTLLTQLGCDPGVTDLPFLPGVDALAHGAAGERGS
jgi:uncharacterized damage-inducible protein DinB